MSGAKIRRLLRYARNDGVFIINQRLLSHCGEQSDGVGEPLINRYILVIASGAWQSHDCESITWRLLRHFVPRNDGLIRGSLDISCHSITYRLFTGMISTEYPERIQASADTVCKMDSNAALTGVLNAADTSKQ